MRRANATRYRDLFERRGMAGAVGLPTEPEGYHHIFNQYIVRVQNQDAVRSRLSAAGIGTEIYYPVPFHLQECFAPLGYRRGEFPRAEAAAASTLALPIYGELTEAQQDAVVAAVADAVAS
jgi:dTDP-4-amino-4,6-dideoxygalactose transaminase